jgi:hypothetical protein
VCVRLLIWKQVVCLRSAIFLENRGCVPVASSWCALVCSNCSFRVYKWDLPHAGQAVFVYRLSLFSSTGRLGAPECQNLPSLGHKGLTTTTAATTISSDESIFYIKVSISWNHQQKPQISFSFTVPPLKLSYLYQLSVPGTPPLLAPDCWAAWIVFLRAHCLSSETIGIPLED